jgi:outer membrane protein TolC
MLNKQLSRLLRGGAAALMLSSAGCVLSPRGAAGEADRVKEAGRAYQRLPWERALPPLPAHPGEGDVVDRAMLADGNLEAAYFQWAAAMQRVTEAGMYPNTNLSLGLSYMLNGGGTAWDRTTVQLSPDAMRNLDWPVEVSTAARAALAQAKAAGAEYADQRRQVRRRAVNAWLDYTLSAEEIRLAKQDLSLLTLAERSAEAMVSAGGGQQALLKAQIASARGRERLHELESAMASQRATLNAMMHRPVAAAIAPPAKLPPATPMALSDDQVLALAARNDPKLAALAHEAAGRADAIELARLQYLPDVNPMLAFTGDISQIGAGLSMPLDRLPAIKAMVREAEDRWRAVAAQFEQARFDRPAQVVMALVMLRHNEHSVMLFSEQVLPVAEQAVHSLQQTYAAGATFLQQVIDAQRTELAVRRTIAEARIGREKALADLEAVVGRIGEPKPQKGTR